MVGSNSRAVREATNFDKNVALKSFRNHKSLKASGREQRASGISAVLWGEPVSRVERADEGLEARYEIGRSISLNAIVRFASTVAFTAGV